MTAPRPPVILGAPPRSASATLAALHREAFAQGGGQAWSEASFAALASDRTILWAESLDSTTLLHGFAIFRFVLDEAELLTICRSPSCAGQGVGAALLETGIDHLSKIGAKTIFLEVSERNLNARSLYRRFGFQLAALRKRYYLRADGGRDDALVMLNQLTAR